MKIRFHKILSDGISVRYETEGSENDQESPVMDLNLIVLPAEKPRP